MPTLSTYTDDTICTLAVADSIMNNKHIIPTLQAWCRSNIHRGYGAMFAEWAMSDNPTPYNSWGNGSAMRISPVPYLCNGDFELMKDLVIKVSEVTHNHPEGIKGAMAIADLMFKSLYKNYTKEQLKNLALEYYPEIKFLNLEELIQTYQFDVSCQGSVPQAIFCFLESTNYKDCIRKCLEIGGDVDTISCMAGGIAEAFYKYIPQSIIDKALSIIALDDIDQKLISTINQFNNIKNN